MPGAPGGTGVPFAFGKVVHADSPRIATVEVVGTQTKDRKFRVPAFTASSGVVKAADPSVASWGIPITTMRRSSWRWRSS